MSLFQRFRKTRYPHKWHPDKSIRGNYLWHCLTCSRSVETKDENFTPPEFGCVPTYHVWKKSTLKVRRISGQLRSRLITDSGKLFQIESSGVIYYECVHCGFTFWPTLMEQTPPEFGCPYKIGNLPIPVSSNSDSSSLPVPVKDKANAP